MVYPSFLSAIAIPHGLLAFGRFVRKCAKDSGRVADVHAVRGKVLADRFSTRARFVQLPRAGLGMSLAPLFGGADYASNLKKMSKSQ